MCVCVNVSVREGRLAPLLSPPTIVTHKHTSVTTYNASSSIHTFNTHLLVLATIGKASHLSLLFPRNEIVSPLIYLCSVESKEIRSYTSIHRNSLINITLGSRSDVSLGVEMVETNQISFRDVQRQVLEAELLNFTRGSGRR